MKISHLIHGHMQPKEIATMYNLSSVRLFASATRGEGYGLPLIDAAAAGIPIVATGWSGHFEFLDKDLIYPVDYSMQQITNTRVDGRIFLEGFRWAEPSRESFCKGLMSVYNDYTSAKSKATKLKKKITSDFHKESIKKMYDKILYT